MKMYLREKKSELCFELKLNCSNSKETVPYLVQVQPCVLTILGERDLITKQKG